MNLQAITGNIIASVNPVTTGSVRMSAGYTMLSSGEQVPAYAPSIVAQLQIQALSGRDLAHMDNLNIQGVMRAIYLQGNWEGIDRPENKGGDLIDVNGQTWLIMQVLESWPDWTKVAVVLQQ